MRIFYLSTYSWVSSTAARTSFNFSRVSFDNGRLLLNAKKEEEGKKEKNTSMVMSDRAANCVLGDKDAGNREK